MNRITCTVFFEDPFWVGIWERLEDGAYCAAKMTFGAQPKDADLHAFVLDRFGTLTFSEPESDDERERSPVSNPKRMQRRSRACNADNRRWHKGTAGAQKPV